MSGSWFLEGSNLEKCGNFVKNGRFSGRIWPDWGNTAWADMAGLGSIGLRVRSMRRISHFHSINTTVFDLQIIYLHWTPCVAPDGFYFLLQYLLALLG